MLKISWLHHLWALFSHLENKEVNLKDVVWYLEL